jgi:NIPSNAP
VTVRDCGVVELRRYTLHPGARETLIELFERELIHSQEAVGMRILGQFRDLDDADAFVWLRGFPDMPARARGLEAFYGGPVWRAHRDAANATMVDSDDVLLLRPVGRAPGTQADSYGLVVGTTCFLAAAADEFPDFFARELEPVLQRTGATVVARYRTEHSENNFPALPVREGEEVFVWLARFPDEAAYARHLAQLERTPRWREGLERDLRERLERAPLVSRLAPTARSMLR